MHTLLQVSWFVPFSSTSISSAHDGGLAPRSLVTLSGNICRISSPLNGDEDKEGEGKNTCCCVNPREGLEPCHSSLSLHQLSLIAREDRIPRTQLFFILFGASEAWKAKGLLLIFLLVFFFVSFFSCHLLLSFPLEWDTPFTLCPLLHPRKNNYQALPHQIMVDIGGRAGQG